jgi:hypothetical protein
MLNINNGQPDMINTNQTTTKWPLVFVADGLLIVSDHAGFADSGFSVPAGDMQYRQDIMDDIFNEYAEEWHELADM